MTARHDLRHTLLGLAAVLAWDAAGWDLAAARGFGGPAGFGARDAWWAATLVHDGGRLLAGLLLGLLAVAAWRAPSRVASGPSRAARWGWLAVVLACLLVVPAAKRASLSSCPWELAAFGGTARHVSHWAWGVADGGSGRCFPSGHAVTAFAFFGMHFLWRGHDRRRARLWLAGVLLAGLVFGGAQLARGAHYPSHVLWSAWACWATCAAAAAAMRRHQRRVRAAAPDRGTHNAAPMRGQAMAQHDLRHREHRQAVTLDPRQTPS